MTSSSCKAPPEPNRWDANRLGLDYRAEAARLGPPPAPIIDAHTHIHGAHAARVYEEARRLYGVERTYSMSMLHEVEPLKAIFGDTIRFIAVPNYLAEDRTRAMRKGFLEDIQAFADKGARIVKFFAAPRVRDMGRELGDDRLLDLDGEWRTRAMSLGESLGMMFMTHVGDPDTWFKAKYTDRALYGEKRDYYIAFERQLDRFTVPWIAAHMGGWPEDLDFLDGLLSRHDNLHLDSSATKWMIRELGVHPRERLVEFLEKWRGRVLFGSDIVTMDAHLTNDEGPRGMGKKASSRQQAFELYASRYWAYRVMLETDHDGESPIADPDLAMVEPDRYDELAAPPLRGKSLPADLLRALYRDASADLVERWHAEHP